MDSEIKKSSYFNHFFHLSSYHWLHSLLILLNLICVVMISSDQLTPEKVHLLNQWVVILRYVFSIELVVRLVLLRGDFFKNHQNTFMAIILIASYALEVPSLTIFLTFAMLKSLRQLSFIPKTRHVIDAFIRTLPGVFNVLFMIILAYVVFGALATILFGKQVPELWGNFMNSFISLQQAMLGDDWGNNLRATMKFYPHAWIFLAIFLFLVSMILLNLFVGIIVDSMQNVEESNDKSSAQDKKETPPLPSHEDDLALIKKDIAEIKKILKKHVES